MGNDLDPLQVKVLEALAGLEPTWTLTGGAALVGFHLHHRTTRDLDLFLYGHATLENYALRAIDMLRAADFEAVSQQSGPSMHRILVTAGGDSTVVDLIADPVEKIEAAIEVSLGQCRLNIDTEYEILVNKLCALVHRSELRDLYDVQQLLAKGGDLSRALADAPRKDGGFSPLTLAWLVGQLPVAAAGTAEGWPPERVEALEEFQVWLLAELSRLSRPAGE